jgi:hypothetical protein
VSQTQTASSAVGLSVADRTRLETHFAQLGIRDDRLLPLRDPGDPEIHTDYLLNMSTFSV